MSAPAERWSIFIPAGPAMIDSLSAELCELGTAGIVEEPAGLRAFFDDTFDRATICAQLSSSLTATRLEPSFDPSQLVPLDCDPILIGQRFFVAPSWVTEPTPAGRIRLTIDTTSAFGSGRHETTQLCIEALETYLKPGNFVADVGCGSGILSVAAQSLGAGGVISCDIHQSSVATAQTLARTPIFVGSADGIRSETFDLVLANLSVKILDIVARDLQRIAKPAGLIVISGFLSDAPPRNFTPWDSSTKGDWGCWICRPQDIDVSTEPTGVPDAHSQQWWL